MYSKACTAAYSAVCRGCESDIMASNRSPTCPNHHILAAMSDTSQKSGHTWPFKLLIALLACRGTQAATCKTHPS